ncbi:DUF4198 domain-containing protein [Desulfoluna spongiiphila]|uniref:Cobalt/nickel transport protein n=1 Tax=Desulfoluna spongiiphila TaxID=419481 RepID=A0A1G5GC95_9BACT|nr:DUF4198 domain-containing protein [Desulfoluna spongiiphila]SCY48840.1 cobalt/nickel transport protein [Desulfoluna spongiiphila]VVS93661.1 protein of unknown function duf4198 [Desulfoluna spongiiphila]
MKRFAAVVALTLGVCLPTSALAHFGMVIPDTSVVSQKTGKQLDLSLSFSHPFEGIGMPLEKPAEFSVVMDGKKRDLTGTLTPAEIMGKPSWTSTYAVKRPGVYSFVMTPKPYWEPAEDIFIIHYTKTIVPAYGGEEGWDDELGLKTEIVPLTRPFGLYAGNLFQGVVKLNGKAVPGAEVEVEFYNRDGKAKAANEYLVTQVVKADANGIFSFTVPTEGWWGFSALNEADYSLEVDGEKKGVELGAVLWVEFSKWQG